MRKVIDVFSQMLLLTILYSPVSILLGLFGWYVLSSVFYYKMSVQVLIGTVHVCIVTLAFVSIWIETLHSALKLLRKPELLEAFGWFIIPSVVIGFVLWYSLKELCFYDMGLLTAMWFTYVCMIFYLYLYNGFLALGDFTIAVFNKVRQL